MIQSMTLIGFIFDMVGALLLSVDITSLSRIDILRSGSMQIGSGIRSRILDGKASNGS